MVCQLHRHFIGGIDDDWRAVLQAFGGALKGDGADGGLLVFVAPDGLWLAIRVGIGALILS